MSTDHQTRPGVPPASALAIPASAAQAAESAEHLVHALVDLAEPLWRARRRVDEEARANERLQIAARLVESAWRRLEEAGVTVMDLTGEPYDDGLNRLVQPLSFSERADCTGETIVETVTPTVCWQGRAIRRGQVIVGVPPRAVAPAEQQAEPQAPRPEEARRRRRAGGSQTKARRRPRAKGQGPK